MGEERAFGSGDAESQDSQILLGMDIVSLKLCNNFYIVTAC